MDDTEDFQQLKLRFIDRNQLDYEVIRPIVLFAETVAERSQKTKIERTTAGAKSAVLSATYLRSSWLANWMRPCRWSPNRPR